MRSHGRTIDRRLLCAVLFFAVFVVVGVMTAEMQLNELTLESDFSRTFNMKRDQRDKETFLYLFGEQISLGRWDESLMKTADGGFGELEKIAALPDSFEAQAKKTAGGIVSIYRETRTAVGVMRKKLEEYYTILRDDLNDYF